MINNIFYFIVLSMLVSCANGPPMIDKKKAPPTTIFFKLEVPTNSTPENEVWVEILVPSSVRVFSAPTDYGGAPVFTKYIDNVTAKSGEEDLKIVTDGPVVHVSPPSEGNYVLRYRYKVPQKISGEVDQSLPVLSKTFARFDHNTLFLKPNGADRWPAEIKIVPPQNWKVVTGWGEALQFQLSTVNKAISGMTVMGDFSYSKSRVGKIDVTFAIKGAYSHHLIKRQFSKVLSAQQEIAGPLPSQHLLIALQPTTNACCKGSSLSDSLIVNIPMNEKFVPFNFRAIGTISHELFHQWNGHYIQSDKNDLIFLLSEGFTNYFAVATLVRANLISEESFAWFLWHYRNLLESNPKYKEADLSKIQSGFTTDDSELVDLAYTRGPFVAVLLDLALREDTHGTASLSKWFRLLGQKYGGDKGYNLSTLRDSFKEVSGKSNGRTIQTFDDYFVGNRSIDVNSLFKRFGIQCVDETKKCTLSRISENKLRSQLFHAD